MTNIRGNIIRNQSLIIMNAKYFQLRLSELIIYLKYEISGRWQKPMIEQFNLEMKIYI